MTFVSDPCSVCKRNYGLPEFHPKTKICDMPDWIVERYQEESTFFNEVYEAVNNEQWWLAAMGIRSLVEYFLDELEGHPKHEGTGENKAEITPRSTDQRRHRSFAERIALLHKENVITLAQHDQLNELVNAGNAAIHTRYWPDLKEIVGCLRILENILESLLLYPRMVESIGDSVDQHRRLTGTERKRPPRQWTI
jgi:hypothetical protein